MNFHGASPQVLIVKLKIYLPSDLYVSLQSTVLPPLMRANYIVVFTGGNKPWTLEARTYMTNLDISVLKKSRMFFRSADLPRKMKDAISKPANPNAWNQLNVVSFH